jgi:hypothetical protein
VDIILGQAFFNAFYVLFTYNHQGSSVQLAYLSAPPETIAPLTIPPFVPIEQVGFWVTFWIAFILIVVILLALFVVGYLVLKWCTTKSDSAE